MMAWNTDTPEEIAARHAGNERIRLLVGDEEYNRLTMTVTMKTCGNDPPKLMEVVDVAKQLCCLVGLPACRSYLIDSGLTFSHKRVYQQAVAMVTIDWYGGPDLDYVERCCLQDKTDPRWLDWQWCLTNKWIPGRVAQVTTILKAMELLNVPRGGACKEFVEYFN